MAQLYTEITGSGDDLLLLLHGLGATGELWSPFIAAAPADRPGRTMVVDLPGHGASGRLAFYGMAEVAAQVAAAVADELPAAGSFRILGHSYGGAVALEIANRGVAGRLPDFVYGLGIKSVWTEAELAGIHALARKPPKLFSDRAAARGWYLRVSGLAPLGEVAAACAERGVREVEDGQWCLAQDPRVNAITAPDMAALTAALRGRFALAYGEGDTMVDVEDLRRFDPGARSLAGGGHNIMVDNPRAVWAWLS